MAVQIVARPSAAEEIGRLLDSPEVVALCDDLDALRWTGRKGYGSRALVGPRLGQERLRDPDVEPHGGTDR